MNDRANTLKEMYEVYLQSGDVQKCVDYVLEIAKTREQVEVQMVVGTWEEKKSKISMRLINTEKNQNLLQTLPHKDFLDLSIVSQMVLHHSENGTATTLINNYLMDYWGIDKEELWETAMQNLNEEEFTVRDLEKNHLEEIIAEMTGREINVEECSGLQYVITNKSTFYGAVSMLRTDLLMELAEKIGMNFFVLPSSVNEIICVPDNGIVTKGTLQEAIQEVNETELEKDEILSNSLYYFDRAKGVIEKLE